MNTKTIKIGRDIWVSGKGIPKGGLCLIKKNESVLVESLNGVDYIIANYKNRIIKIATIASSLAK